MLITISSTSTVTKMMVESGRPAGSRGPRPSSVPERTYAPRDAETAAPVAPKRTERVDDFADFSFGKIEL